MNDFLNGLDGALRGSSRLPELELSWTRQPLPTEHGDLDQGAGSIDDVIDGPWDGGTNEGELWDDEDTVKDVVLGLTSLGETEGAGQPWPIEPWGGDET